MRILLVGLLIFIPAVCFGGFLIEPYAGFDYGLSSDTDITYQNNAYTFESEPSSGLSYGGRLGYSFAGLFVAADYSLSSFEIEDKAITSGGVAFSNGTKVKNSVDQSALGIAVGFKFPALFRIWGKYLFNVTWEIADDKWLQSLPLGTAAFKTELSGSGYAFGLGYTVVPFVNIFAEYQIVTVDEPEKIEFEGTEQKADFQIYERTRSSILIGVSLPIDI